MKRIACLIVAVALVVALYPAMALAHTADAPFKTDLVAGREKADVGDVLIWNDATNLYVKYVVTKAGWGLTETHLSVRTAVSLIPQMRGNPIPGKFEFKKTHAFVSEYLYTIPKSWPEGTKLYIAAHGVAEGKCTNGDGVAGDFCATLPSTANVSVSQNKTNPAATSFFDVTVSGGTSLDGLYPGWCMNPRLYNSYNLTLLSDVYCSLNPVPAGATVYPENMDKVNWLLNQDLIGQNSAYFGTPYTWSQMQIAIWLVLNDYYENSGLVWDEPPVLAKAQELAGMAHASGSGFVPMANEYAGVILIAQEDPYAIARGTMAQPILITVKVPDAPVVCVSDTVWGAGADFSGANWAMYSSYTVQ